jgi:hypothetical protein
VTKATKEVDDGWSIRALGLRLEFRWTGDRWTHSLDVGSDDHYETIVRAFNIAPELENPASVVSPAFQQVEFQGERDRRSALLLGQSGPHHFSAVFQVWERDNEAGVDVDLADRCRYDLDRLACTYHVLLNSGELQSADDRSIAWQSPRFGGGGLVLEALGSTRVALAEGGRAATRVQALGELNRAGATHRCTFRWRWLAPPESPCAD